ncbi:MAG: GNAT family N-acetyltransferase [Patescibacteria group bacterium]|jgi:CelD/BcsL family acetyltransferase involved in cellulose biosynthesis
MIEIRCVNDKSEAERLWRALSPQKTIFDDWDFRYCFYEQEPHPWRFYVAWEKKDDGSEEAVGLMPLQFNADWGGLEFMAEDPCEENRIFFRPGYDQVVRLFYEHLKQGSEPAKFYDISGEDEFTKSLPIEDYKYVLPLAGLKDFNDFLARRLSAKRRRSLLKELAAVENNKLEVSINSFSADGAGDFMSDLERLFELNTANFVGESYLKKETERAAWRGLIKLPFAWRLAIVKVDEIKQAVSLSVLYKGEWHYLITGVNFKDFVGLGKYLVKVNIEAALAEKAEVFDAGLGDCGWKNLWHFDRLPQYEFIK